MLRARVLLFAEESTRLIPVVGGTQSGGEAVLIKADDGVRQSALLR